MFVVEGRDARYWDHLLDSNYTEGQWNLIYVRKEAKTRSGCWMVDM